MKTYYFVSNAPNQFIVYKFNRVLTPIAQYTNEESARKAAAALARANAQRTGRVVMLFDPPKALQSILNPKTKTYHDDYHVHPGEFPVVGWVVG